MSVMNPRFLPLFFFNDTATTEIYTLSLHDALPISLSTLVLRRRGLGHVRRRRGCEMRSEEHTSELQSHSDLVCRLLLGKKNRACPSTHAYVSRPYCATNARCHLSSLIA